MIYLNGINLLADDVTELHELARKLGISKSWWRAEEQCYDVICPFRLEYIEKYIKRHEIRINSAAKRNKGKGGNDVQNENHKKE